MTRESRIVSKSRDAPKMGRSSQNRPGKWLIVNERVFKIFIFVPKCVLETEPAADTAKGKPETKRFTEARKGREGHKEANRGICETRGRGSTERTPHARSIARLHVVQLSKSRNLRSHTGYIYSLNLEMQDKIASEWFGSRTTSLTSSVDRSHWRSEGRFTPGQPESVTGSSRHSCRGLLRGLARITDAPAKLVEAEVPDQQSNSPCG